MKENLVLYAQLVSIDTYRAHMLNAKDPAWNTQEANIMQARKKMRVMLSMKVIVFVHMTITMQ